MQFKLTPKQYEFIGAYEQFPAYIAAVGCGKSTALIGKALFHSEESPNNLGVIVRKNFTDLRDSTLKDYELYTGRKVKENNKEDILPNGSVIMFRHGDELPTLKNINLGWFAIEQGEEFQDDTSFQFLKMRLRRKVKFRTGFMIANTNGHNWIYKLLKENGSPENHKLIECTTYEHRDALRALGEMEALPDDYIKNLETLPKKLFNRYVMNSWEEAEGLVYDEFLESKHVVEPFDIPKTWEKGFVLDHGFRNPTAGLWYAIDHDGTIYLYDEHYEREQPISYHAEKIKERGIFDGLADPSIFSQTLQKAGKVYSIADEYKDFGVTLRPAYRSKEDASIARVNEFFKANRIKIFKNNVNTIHEISNWKWREVRPTANVENLPEEPQDKDNHLCDDLKYLIASRFSAAEKPKEKSKQYSLAYYEEQEEFNSMQRLLEQNQ